jgi:hypothetical protein
MTEVPVLGCAIDHLLQARVLDDATNVRVTLRLSIANWVLDGIDAYGYEALQALHRLCHTAGLHGRRVMVMSATVSRTVLKAIFEPWWAWLSRVPRTPAGDRSGCRDGVLAGAGDRELQAADILCGVGRRLS